MIEAYSVSATLRLVDMVSVPLAKISTQFKELDVLSASLNASLKKLGVETAGMKALANASRELDRHLGGANNQAERLERNLSAIKAMNLGVPGSNAVPIPYPRGYGGSGKGGGHSGGIHYGAAGIGVSSATVGLGQLAVPAAIAGAGIYVEKKFYDSAKDYQTEVARLTMFGLSETQMKSAEAYVTALKTRGVSRAQNMRFFTEAQGVFRESGLEGEAALEGAKLATPWLAKIYYATEALDDASKEQMRHSSLAMLRFIEQMGGVKDPATFQRLAEGGWKAIRASGGVVDWEQYRQFAARAGVAGQFMNPDVLFGELEPIIGELKGSTAGFSLRTAYNRLNGIVKIPNQVAHMLAESGIWDASKVEWNSMGGIKSFKGNPLKDAELLMHDPVAFYEQKILPMYKNKGLGVAERAQMNAMLFGSTGGNLFTKIDQQLPTLHKSMEAYQRTLGIDKTVAEVNKTASGAELEFDAAWSTFKTELGRSILPKITEFLNNMSSFLRRFSDFHERHKEIFDVVESVPVANAGGIGAKAFQYGSQIGSWARNLVFGSGDSKKQGDVYIDGRLAGKVMAPHVTNEQARAAARPTGGTTGHDGRMSPSPVGAQGSW